MSEIIDKEDLVDAVKNVREASKPHRILICYDIFTDLFDGDDKDV